VLSLKLANDSVRLGCFPSSPLSKDVSSSPGHVLVTAWHQANQGSFLLILPAQETGKSSSTWASEDQQSRYLRLQLCSVPALGLYVLSQERKFKYS